MSVNGLVIAIKDQMFNTNATFDFFHFSSRVFLRSPFFERFIRIATITNILLLLNVIFHRSFFLAYHEFFKDDANRNYI